MKRIALAVALAALAAPASALADGQAYRLPYENAVFRALTNCFGPIHAVYELRLRAFLKIQAVDAGDVIDRPCPDPIERRAFQRITYAPQDLGGRGPSTDNAGGPPGK